MAKNEANQNTKGSYRERIDELSKKAAASGGTVFEDLRFFTSRKNQIQLKINQLKNKKSVDELTEMLEEFTVRCAELFAGSKR